MKQQAKFWSSFSKNLKLIIHNISYKAFGQLQTCSYNLGESHITSTVQIVVVTHSYDEYETSKVQ